MEETAEHTITFAEAAYNDRDNFNHEALSPYLPYSLAMAAIIQYRLSKKDDNPIFKVQFDSLVGILKDFSKRWLAAGKLLVLTNYDMFTSFGVLTIC
jgi:hypothetical protein